jgi:hypothetical protein
MGLSSSPEPGYEGHICEVLQEDHCSSMYSNYYALSSCILMFSRIVLLFLHLGNLIRNIDWCLFFRRLRINLDTHEFILESGTIANTSIPASFPPCILSSILLLIPPFPPLGEWTFCCDSLSPGGLGLLLWPPMDFLL